MFGLRLLVLLWYTVLRNQLSQPTVLGTSRFTPRDAIHSDSSVKIHGAPDGIQVGHMQGRVANLALALLIPD